MIHVIRQDELEDIYDANMFSLDTDARSLLQSHNDEGRALMIYNVKDKTRDIKSMDDVRMVAIYPAGEYVRVYDDEFFMNQNAG